MPSKMRALPRGTVLTRSEKKQVGPVQIVVLGAEQVMRALNHSAPPDGDR